MDAGEASLRKYCGEQKLIKNNLISVTKHEQSKKNLFFLHNKLFNLNLIIC